MYLNKKETWELADKLDCLEQVVMLSHTCYNGNRETLNNWGYGCGECPACVLRENGYTQYVADTLKIQKSEWIKNWNSKNRIKKRRYNLFENNTTSRKSNWFLQKWKNSYRSNVRKRCFNLLFSWRCWKNNK